MLEGKDLEAAVGFEPTKYGGFANRCPENVTPCKHKSCKSGGRDLTTCLRNPCEIPPDLAALTRLWATLPEAARESIMQAAKDAAACCQAGGVSGKTSNV